MVHWSDNIAEWTGKTCTDSHCETTWMLMLLIGATLVNAPSQQPRWQWSSMYIS